MAAINLKAYLLLIARLVLAGTFLLAALPKIQDPVAFTASVQGFRIIDGDLTAWVAIILPWLELIIGFGLLIPQIRRGCALIIAVLLVAFIALHANAWSRGLDISCGCFGQTEASEDPGYLWLILRNTALLVACACVLIRDWRNPNLRNLTKVDTSS